MKTLTETLDNGKARTIRVSWNGNSFDVYKQTPEKDAFVFWCRLFSCRLTKGSRAKTIFNELNNKLDREYEHNLARDYFSY